MDIDSLRRLCLSFPGATEQVQWGSDLLFKVHGKMFAVTPLEPAPVWLSLKVTPENFVELTERPGVIPAPYLARASWIAIESPTILPTPELASLLRGSYDLVVAKLPRKLRESLADHRPTARASSKTRPITKTARTRKPKKSTKPSRKLKRK
jgi:predicted DNA-binding protein (MmcQ/YjbR family)